MAILKVKNEDEAVENVLREILDTDEFKVDVAKIPEQIHEHILECGYSRRVTDYLLDALDRHFDQDLLDVVKPDAVFKLLHDEMKVDIAELDVQIIDRETVREAYGDKQEKFMVDRTISEILEAIQDAARRLYEKKLDATWQTLGANGVSPIEHFKCLEEMTDLKIRYSWRKQLNTAYVLLLDKDMKLTREPYPDMDLTVNPDVTLTTEYIQEEHHYRTYRTLHVTYSRPITNHFGNHDTYNTTGTQHTARKDEVNVVTITT